MTINFGISID